MREIKFRAWDKHEKHFVYFELFKGVNRYTSPIYNHAILEDWQQFTGLLDKNGKEIYEGDILDGKLKNGKKIFIKVIWHEAKLKFCKERIGRIKCSGLTNPTKRHYNGEVVGNIYENPELIK